ncbi:Uncharacterised protein [Mycobacterium tuberculosis]|nr:Uncharacterised protein [Mycobacterium tuberculosis]
MPAIAEQLVSVICLAVAMQPSNEIGSILYMPIWIGHAIFRFDEGRGK